MSSRPGDDPRFGRIWGWPSALGVLTLAGLVSALLGEGGVWWAVCWIALGVPLAVVAACLLRSR